MHLDGGQTVSVNSPVARTVHSNNTTSATVFIQNWNVVRYGGGKQRNQNISTGFG